jgi:hypothetical protein
MKLVRILYLVSFFAPVAFLLGYILGAPTPLSTPPHYQPPPINRTAMPVSEEDFYRFEGSLATSTEAPLNPNSAYTQ